jgi:long-chain acyl-CoA synthetase
VRPEAVERFLAARGVAEPDPERRALHPEVRAELARGIEAAVNPRLARHETIKTFEVLPRELTEGEGELTPTQKIKRKVVAERYAAAIERLYPAEDGAPGG